MRGQETDHGISGPIRGLTKKMHPMAQTNRRTSGHCDSMTENHICENHVHNILLVLLHGVVEVILVVFQQRGWH